MLNKYLSYNRYKAKNRLIDMLKRSCLNVFKNSVPRVEYLMYFFPQHGNQEPEAFADVTNIPTVVFLLSECSI